MDMFSGVIKVIHFIPNPQTLFVEQEGQDGPELLTCVPDK